MKQVKPIYLYMGSMISFVISNMVREQNHILYVVLLVTGLVLFLLGLLLRIKGK